MAQLRHAARQSTMAGAERRAKGLMMGSVFSIRRGAIALPALMLVIITGCSSVRPTAAGTAPDAGARSAAAFPGMNAQGDVIDSAMVEMGHGTKVVGIDDQEGEVLGKPAPGSRFGKVKVGMDMDKVIELLGPPSDKGTRMSGTMFNPFYFGSDKYKREFVYRGMGRLVFGERGPWGGNHLIWIIHRANEPATR